MIDHVSKIAHLSRALTFAKLQMLLPSAEEFQDVMSRKELRDKTKQKMQHENLPKLFLTDAAS